LGFFREEFPATCLFSWLNAAGNLRGLKDWHDEMNGGGNRHVSQYWRLCHRRCAHLHFIPSHIILALT
jgi:hypothetical protein